MIKICAICGKEFEVDDMDINRNRRKYCGEDCAIQAAYRRKRRYLLNGKNSYTVKCDICGKVFTTCYSQKTTCSTECREERVKRNSREAGRARREAILNGTLPKPERKKAKQNRVATVEEVQKKAREAGMSYGKYMAMLYMKEGRT
jgi:hypothetical protein